MNEFSHLSKEELRDRIFKELSKLLRTDNHNYKRLFKRYLGTMFEAGEIYTPPPSTIKIKNPEKWTNSLWRFIHLHKN